MKVLKAVLMLVGVLAALLALVFVWLAIGVHLSGPWQVVAKGAVVLSLFWVLWGVWQWRPSIPFGVAAGIALIMTVWWTFVPALNDRDWAPEYARTLTATIDGDRITLENVRNFRWQTIDKAEEGW